MAQHLQVVDRLGRVGNAATRCQRGVGSSSTSTCWLWTKPAPLCPIVPNHSRVGGMGVMRALDRRSGFSWLDTDFRSADGVGTKVEHFAHNKA